MKRHVFFISDGTGITAETLGHSILSQFESIEFEQSRIPYVESTERAHAAVAKINEEAQKNDSRPIVFSSLVKPAEREILANCNAFVMDLFASFVSPLETELGVTSSKTIGQSHGIINEDDYGVRIDAVHFALDNDDGARTRMYDQADIILTGVSRSGKTPTCLYLALQFGIRAANYPLTEDDLDDIRLPKCLREHKDKLFGLSIDPERLANIRQERKANSRYASIRQCEDEIRGAEAIFNKERVPYINSTHFSIEEISTKILAEMKINKVLQ